eukprot:6195483-Pleurochrysis_carterae.AAC.1
MRAYVDARKRAMRVRLHACCACVPPRSDASRVTQALCAPHPRCRHLALCAIHLDELRERRVNLEFNVHRAFAPRAQLEAVLGRLGRLFLRRHQEAVVSEPQRRRRGREVERSASAAHTRTHMYTHPHIRTHIRTHAPAPTRTRTHTQLHAIGQEPEPF